MNAISAIAITMKQTRKPEFVEYQQQVRDRGCLYVTLWWIFRLGVGHAITMSECLNGLLKVWRWE